MSNPKKLKLVSRNEQAIRNNQSNRNTARGLFKGIISGNILPSLQNITRLLSSAYKGWLDPEKENPNLSTGAPDILPGFQLKGLMMGNQLEQQLSKAGTISTNAVKALANKSSEMQGKILNKVLDNQFPAQRVVDYDKFRKAVQSELISYKQGGIL